MGAGKQSANFHEKFPFFLPIFIQDTQWKLVMQKLKTFLLLFLRKICLLLFLYLFPFGILISCFSLFFPPHFFFFNKFIYLFIYFWLCWVFASVRGLSLVVASGGHSSSRCAGLSLSQPLLLRSTGSRRAGSVVVAHGPICSTACGIFPDQGSNPCPLHWQADSQPLRHQGGPPSSLLILGPSVLLWLKQQLIKGPRAFMSTSKTETGDLPNGQELKHFQSKGGN